MERSISSASRSLIALTSMPSDGATDWITAYWPIPAEAGSRRTAARVTLGAICLRSSSHLPHKLYSNVMNPVALPPGRARLLTKPSPTGSTTITKTIGIVWVACSIGGTAGLPETRMTSGASAANSAAYFRGVGGVGAWPAIVDLHVSAFGPAQSAAALEEMQPCALAPADRPLRCQPRASQYGAHGPAAAPARRAAEMADAAAPPSAVRNAAA